MFNQNLTKAIAQITRKFVDSDYFKTIDEVHEFEKNLYFREKSNSFELVLKDKLDTVCIEVKTNSTNESLLDCFIKYYEQKYKGSNKYEALFVPDYDCGYDECPCMVQIFAKSAEEAEEAKRYIENTADFSFYDMKRGCSVELCGAHWELYPVGNYVADDSWYIYIYKDGEVQD